MAVFGKASMGREDAMSANVVIKGRWCLTGDGKLVPEGDPEARWLWAIDGQEIPEDEAKAVGYGVKPAVKQGRFTNTSNKQLRPQSNK